MKRIAIITGASSGMGRQYAKTIKDNIEFDELWVIARRTDRLEELKKELDFPVKTISLDLSEKESYAVFQKSLEEEKASDNEFSVTMLMNCSGYGKFGHVNDYEYDVYLNMINLNCSALTSLCRITIPYMKKGACIVNISSLASYQPTPYMNVYSATKAYVQSFSRALAKELKRFGIQVLTVCPYWTKSEFFNRAIDNSKEPVVKKYVTMYTVDQIVNKTWKDLRKKKELCIPGFIARAQVRLVKFLPVSFVMKTWMKQQKLK